jgi:hypothetical protein
MRQRLKVQKNATARPDKIMLIQKNLIFVMNPLALCFIFSFGFILRCHLNPYNFSEDF